MGRPKLGPVAGFPDDTLLEILSRVPFRSTCRFKCVSKAWRDLIADPLNRTKLPQTLEGLFHEIHRRREGNGNNEGGSNNLRRHSCVGFVDLSGRPVPLVDPSFSFLRKVPGFESIRLFDSCNGLLLFERVYNSDMPPSYIVCNPATEQWVAVPDSDWTPPPYMSNGTSIYLIFDRAAPSHFHLVQFWNEVTMGVTSVHTYSSKTGAWTHSESAWSVEEKQGPLEGWRYHSCCIVPEKKSAVVNGMLYLICDSVQEGQVLDGDYMIAVDVEGKTRKIIPAPFQVHRGKCSILSDFVGQSQGRLHYINHEEEEAYTDDDDVALDHNNNEEQEDHNNDGVTVHHISHEEQDYTDDGAPSELSANVHKEDIDGDNDVEGRSYRLSIWVLKDDDSQEFVLKHSVSFLHLFGEKSCQVGVDYNVVAIHPDRNLVFFVRNDKLISYDMDSKEVCALRTVNDGYAFTPYVPYFAESLALTNKD